MKFTVELNGTQVNPYHVCGLTQNPFPQIAHHEYAAAMLIVQSLGGDPIPNIDYIRDRLKGFSSEFIELCCQRFCLGVITRFEVDFKE